MLRAALSLFGGVALGGAAALHRRSCLRNDEADRDSGLLPAVRCYKSIEDPNVFKDKGYKRKVFSTRFQPYQLGEIIPITHDVALFRFLLHDPNDEFNLVPCSTLQAMYKHGVHSAQQCMRFYTPVTANRTKGYFDIIVKRKKDGHMTNHLFGMHVGDKLLFRNVAFKVQYRPNRWKKIGMIAGGTGFTPMLQVIRHALMEPETGEPADRTQLSFLYCNRTDRHVLLKGLFDDLAKKHPDRFRVTYTVDKAVDKSWPHWTGYVTKEMLRETMPGPKDETGIVMICGPDHLVKHIAGVNMNLMHEMSSGKNLQPTVPNIANMTDLSGLLGQMGYNNEQVYRF
jgi:cytochrome-b5 reductase